MIDIGSRVWIDGSGDIGIVSELRGETATVIWDSMAVCKFNVVALHEMEDEE
jgi:hypothetical protein